MDAKLILFKGNGQRKDIPLKGEVMIIGRGEDCDLRIPLAAVSRRHCELTIGPDSLTAKDLDSSNGTYINNEKIEAAEELRAGDILMVGSVLFTVQIDGVPEEIQPPQPPLASKPAKSDEEEELVDIEADEDNEAVAGLKAAAMEDDTDPTSALEALAAGGENEEEQAPQKPKKKK